MPTNNPEKGIRVVKTPADIKTAIMSGETHVLLNGVLTKIPTPQRTGTDTQRLAYAQQQADRIFKLSSKEPKAE